MVCSSPSDSRRNVRNAYVVALSLIALVTVGTQIVIQWSLRAEEKSADTVNAAGLQRMRSQRLAMSAWIAVYEDDSAAAEEVSRILAELTATHQRLAAESSEGRSPHNGRSARMLADVGLILGRFGSAVARLSQGERTPAVAKELTELADEFLPQMDALVSEFAGTAKTRLQRVRGVEYGLAALVLIILLLEATLIFAPLTRRLERSERSRESLMNRLEVDLAESLHEVERSRGERAVSLVASGVAHDLNNYIQVIVSHGEALADHHQQNESVTAIQRAALDCSSLCRQLLALNPSQRGSTPVNVDLGVLTRELLPLLRGVLPASMSLEVRVEPPSPAIHADPQQLRQALLNLCINAREACASDGEIVLEVRATAGQAQIVVADNGEGISEEIRARIFEPFFSTKSKDAGVGLGLAAVSAIVDDNGGTLNVSSTVGEGTRVELSFPLVEPTPELRSVPSALRILYIEDNRAIRRAGVRMLQAMGHRVSDAEGGEEALGFARTSTFDLIVSDVILGDTLGPDLVRELRSVQGPIPAVLVTGHAGDWDQSLDAGVTLVRKPYGRRDLEAAEQLL
ncbi:MAG: ATP-binding protein, partial [Myxococcota bacterium]